MILKDLAAALPTDRGVVDCDLPCQTCGYNLRTLPAGGNCPECGSAISLSLDTNLLRDADPRYVQSLAGGAGYIFRGIQTALFSAVVVLPLGFITLAFAVWMVILVGINLGIALMLLGSWKLTIPNPQGPTEDRVEISRRIVRITVLVFACCQAAGIVLPLMEWDDATQGVALAITLTANLVLLIGFFAQMRYVRHLALRIPDPQLAWFARTVAWIGVIASGSTFLGSSGLMFEGALFIAIGAVAGFAVIVLSWWAMGRLARRLREQATLALQSPLKT